MEAAHWFHVPVAGWDDLEMADVSAIVVSVRQIRAEQTKQSQR